MAKSSASERVGTEGGEREGGFLGWMLGGAFLLLMLAVVGVVAGGYAGDVFQTWVYGLLVLPVVVAAGMAGLALTEPFARRGLFEAGGGSPWADGYRGVVSVAVGLGVLGLGMLGLGAVHLVDPPWVPVLMLVAAVAAGWAPTRRFVESFRWGPMMRRVGRGEWLILFGAVGVGVMLIAATFPPGSLWVSEGRGYDVLEYHLEMPREYGQTDSIMPVGHNVYSYLPATVEMDYLLMMQEGRLVMGVGGRGNMDHLWGVYPAQLLHALLAMLAMMGVVLAPIRMRGLGRAVAGVVLLCVPWTVVTGSMAYDEWGMMLYGVLAVGLALRPRQGTATGNFKFDFSEGVLIGVLLGLAVGCKMTAGVFFAVPVGIVMLMRGRVKGVVLAAVIAALVYSPWAIRAAVESGGNPVFPIAGKMLGHDGWTMAQVERFDRGHGAPAGERTIGGRLGALWRELLLNQQWSVGWASIYRWAGEQPPPPPPEGAWWKYFGVLWVVAPIGVVMALARRAKGWRLEPWGLMLVLLLQLAAWLFLTHLESRFLLPIVAPLGWLVGIGAEVEGGPAWGGVLLGGLRVIVCAVVCVQAVCGMFLLLPEAGLLGGLQKGKPGGGGSAGGPPIGELFSRVVNIAEGVEQPNGGAGPAAIGKILLVGNAAPLFWQGEIVYNTTFDRNPLGDELRGKGPVAAAKWLRDQGFNYVVIDWGEVNRLRSTYGFDGAITPEAMQGLIQAGIRPAPVEAPPGLTILQVKRTGG